jgi:hypothetical protein
MAYLMFFSFSNRVGLAVALVVLVLLSGALLYGCNPG